MIIIPKLLKLIKKVYNKLYYKVLIFDENNINTVRNFPKYVKTLYLDYDVIKKAFYNIPFFNSYRMLEIGCGYGRLTTFLKQFTNYLVSIDKEKDMIILCKKLYPKLNFLTMDITKKPLRIGKFDFIITFTVLQHISNKNIVKACKNINFLLVRKGYFLLIEQISDKNYQKNLHNWNRTIEKYKELLKLNIIASNIKINNNIYSYILFRKD